MKGQKMKIETKLCIGLAILAVLSPIGLLLPSIFGAGSAWGEWGADEMKGLIGYIPVGLEKLSSLWTALFPDYSFAGWEGASLPLQSVAYVVSAVVGIALCLFASWGIGKAFARKRA
jgi:hypothetical protein